MKKLSCLFGITAVCAAFGISTAIAEDAGSVPVISASESPMAAGASAADGTISDEAAGLYSRIPGLRAADDINGMRAWTAPGQNLIFMRDAMTGAYVVGFPFDAEGRTLIPGAAEVENSGIDQLLSELFAPRINIPDSYAPTVEERLSGLSEEERDNAINALISSVRDVRDEAEFNRAIEAWIDALPEDDAAPAAEEAPETIDEEASAAQSGPTLLEAVRNAAYVEIGDRAAPMAYVFLDPACHACRAAMAEVRDRVEAGDLQLRVLLVPAVDADSPGVIAGMAATGDIGKTLMALSAEEDADLPFDRPSTLSDAIASGIEENLDIARTYQLPSLPFFIYEKEDGPFYVSGLPSIEQFEGIILADADMAPDGIPPAEEPSTDGDGAAQIE
ncbi:hypothetical protein [Paracoccus sp. ME4]|uniref:hypothetical protein n=1 Tax=Paracoccus sp. ME4 TaxID=3138066 RepID=UPI00398B676B